MKTIIIGGVAGGATCATRLRRLDEKMDIRIYEKTNYVSYANCGLPYYISGVINDKKQLTLQTKESFKKRFNIEVFTNHEVLEINAIAKEVIVKDLKTNNIFKDNYDKLVIATGALPYILNISGKELGLTLKTVEDTYLIDDYINKNKVNKAVVVGGGFIGLEVVENLALKGINTTLVEKLDQVLGVLDKDLAVFVEDELKDKKVDLKLNKELIGLVKTEDGIVVKLNDEEFKTDLVIFALGVYPNSALAKDLNLELGIKGSIKVNKYLETSQKDIYACGDVIEVNNYITNKETLVSLAGPANKQARIVANNICGYKEEYKGALGTSVIKVFDLTVGFVGLNEKEAKRQNINYDKIYLSPNDHASYYKTSYPLNMKVIFDKDNYKLLGAEIVSKADVSKKIDILALAIFNKMSILDLKDVDFAYAPPFNSAKDAINMLSYIASNLKEGIVKQYYIEDIKDLVDNQNVTLLDVRTKAEYYAGHIKNYINIPLDELRANILKLDQNKPVYVICESAIRSYIACRILHSSGFITYNLAGGYRLYKINYKNESLSDLAYPCGQEK